MNDIKVIRSKRRTLALKIDMQKRITVRAPLFVSEKEILRFVESHTEWIKKNLARIEDKSNRFPPLSDDEIKALKNEASVVLREKTHYYAVKMGVQPTAVKITSAQKRFGSCSAKNSICYSYNLMRYPEDAIDYVVVHELAHIKHKNHSAVFYGEIAKILPDYKRREKLLK